MTGPLESTLRSLRDDGRKALVPYITGDLFPEWLEVLSAVIDNGASAVEIGIPFSDPVMDGPTIQAANDRALARGATPHTILGALRDFEAPIPLAAMTYYNIAFRMGHERYASMLTDAGVTAAILPDMPLEESEPWTSISAGQGIETIQFAAPTSPDDRLVRVGAAATGFVYAVGLLGITGVRTELASSAIEIARRVKDVTDMPVLVGVGISNPEQAVQACEVADGVIVGSAIVQKMLDGEGAAGVGTLVHEFRAALDEAFPG